MRKKLNNLPRTSSDETSDSDNNHNGNSDNNDDNDDNDDSDDNQISNFVDRVLKKVSKEIVNDDGKNDDSKKLLKLSKENVDLKKKLNILLEANQKAKKNITKQIEKMKASDNLFNKQVSNTKKFLKLVKKESKLDAENRAKTNKLIEKILAKNKAREEDSKNFDEMIKKHDKNEAQRSFEKIKKFNKIISDNPNMSSEKSEIINKLIKLHSLKETYYLNKTNNNSEKNKETDITLLNRKITELEKFFRDQGGSGVFTSKNEFVKLLILLTQLLTKTSSKEFKNDTSKLLKNLYNTKQITKRVYNILNEAITYKNDS